MAAINTVDGNVLWARRMPLSLAEKKPALDAPAFLDMIAHDLEVDVFVLEQVHSMPGQGVSSSFQFGRMYGAAEALVMSLERSLVRVTPQVWKKHHNLGPDKRASLHKAAVLYPGTYDWSVLANEGIAEAALIAQWFVNTRLGR